jgi:superfamily II DNA or RNA helicase
MPKADRKARIADFRAGRTDVLTNVDLLTTGFDMPQIEVGIFLRPTQSLALYLQMVGRILRIAPGKNDAVLLDHVGNVLRHGMPDATREWTLEGRAKRAAAPPVRQCPACYAAFTPAPRCPACSYVFPVGQKRSAAAERDGDLTQITETDGDLRMNHLKTAPLRDLVKGAKTREALEEIRAARGYNRGWVQAMLNAKAAARARAIANWRGGAA